MNYHHITNHPEAGNADLDSQDQNLVGSLGQSSKTTDLWVSVYSI